MTNPALPSSSAPSTSRPYGLRASDQLKKPARLAKTDAGDEAEISDASAAARVSIGARTASSGSSGSLKAVEQIVSTSTTSTFKPSASIKPRSVPIFKSGQPDRNLDAALSRTVRVERSSTGSNSHSTSSEEGPLPSRPIARPVLPGEENEDEDEALFDRSKSKSKASAHRAEDEGSDEGILFQQEVVEESDQYDNPTDPEDIGTPPSGQRPPVPAGRKSKLLKTASSSTHKVSTAKKQVLASSSKASSSKKKQLSSAGRTKSNPVDLTGDSSGAPRSSPARAAKDKAVTALTSPSKASPTKASPSKSSQKKTWKQAHDDAEKRKRGELVKGDTVGKKASAEIYPYFKEPVIAKHSSKGE
ncbi:hypothetical protein V8E36_001824 [Tilletia maclaganii]